MVNQLLQGVFFLNLLEDSAWDSSKTTSAYLKEIFLEFFQKFHQTFFSESFNRNSFKKYFTLCFRNFSKNFLRNSSKIFSSNFLRFFYLCFSVTESNNSTNDYKRKLSVDFLSSTVMVESELMVTLSSKVSNYGTLSRIISGNPTINFLTIFFFCNYTSL